MSLVESEPALIGLDWGTTSLRAFLMDANGGVLETVQTGQGIMQVKDRDFDAVFQVLLGPWLEQHDLPVIASGMITSRNGWVETPYVPVPAGSADLANSLVRHESSSGCMVHFVTGLSIEHSGSPDVMRGEETQIVGAAAMGHDSGTFVMPGTHSKWVTVKDGEIVGYKTYMTGEVFAALKGHTILGALMEEGPFSPQGFDLGVQTGLEAGGELLHRIFSARSLPLFGKIAGTMVADYLSGILIGSEIAAGSQNLADDNPIMTVGRGDLVDRYSQAMNKAGLQCQHAPEAIAASGLFEIAKSAGLLK